MKKTNLMLLTATVMSGMLCSCQPKDNTLTKSEEEEGWILLFNGQDLSEWCNFNDTVLSNGWTAVDGCIQASGGGADDSGYIVTKRKFADFELTWDWKLMSKGYIFSSFLRVRPLKASVLSSLGSLSHISGVNS